MSRHHNANDRQLQSDDKTFPDSLGNTSSDPLKSDEKALMSASMADPKAQGKDTDKIVQHTGTHTASDEDLDKVIEGKDQEAAPAPSPAPAAAVPATPVEPLATPATPVAPVAKKDSGVRVSKQKTGKSEVMQSGSCPFKPMLPQFSNFTPEKTFEGGWAFRVREIQSYTGDWCSSMDVYGSAGDDAGTQFLVRTGVAYDSNVLRGAYTVRPVESQMLNGRETDVRNRVVNVHGEMAFVCYSTAGRTFRLKQGDYIAEIALP